MIGGLKLVVDHLAYCAESLAAGTAAIEEVLGVRFGPVGHHRYMSTHNRLLSLGPGEYFEVIAIDPDAPSVAHSRWFGLDDFVGVPRLTNWILRSDDLDSALDTAPVGVGRPVALERGDFRWRMAIPATGRLPYDDAYPALIEWLGDLHPSQRLPDSGCRLQRLEVAHPKAAELCAALPLHDKRVVFVAGQKAIRATILTPHGLRVVE